MCQSEGLEAACTRVLGLAKSLGHHVVFDDHVHLQTTCTLHGECSQVETGDGSVILEGVSARALRLDRHRTS